MLTSLLMGLVGGQRAMTPLATVALAAARGELPTDNGAPDILTRPRVALGALALALAVAEMAGDKMERAPDRIAPIGLAARFATSAISGAALAPRAQRWPAAMAAGLTAIAASYLGWRVRTAFTPRYGRIRTGFIEDAAVLAAAITIVGGVGRTGRRTARA